MNCLYCSAPLPPSHRGPRRIYCKSSCCQRAYELRKLTRDRPWPEVRQWIETIIKGAKE